MNRKNEEKRTRSKAALSSDESFNDTPLKQQKIMFSKRGEKTKVKQTEPNLGDIIEEIKRLEQSFTNTIREELEKVKNELQSARVENEVLREEVEAMRSVIKNNEKKNNDLEQYIRRNNVRVFGVRDSVWEKEGDTETKIMELINKKLKVNIFSTNIEAVHRIGRHKNGYNRPIIVRFISRKDATRCLSNRRLLKGSGVVLVEDLTATNARWYGTIRNHPGVVNAWTKNGTTFYKRKDEVVRKAPLWEDLENVETRPTPARLDPSTAALNGEPTREHRPPPIVPAHADQVPAALTIEPTRERGPLSLSPDGKDRQSPEDASQDSRPLSPEAVDDTPPGDRRPPSTS